MLLKNVSLSFFISTHTPHARRDSSSRFDERGIFIFQLTRLMRGVTQARVSEHVPRSISTHTPHARRDAANCL